MQRYFVKKVNDNIRLEDSDFHHVKDVMRIASDGNIICVFNNKSYLCSIKYDKKDYHIDVLKEITSDVELSKNVYLYQALIKNDKFDLIVQKAVELGVSHIIPTIFKRSIIKVSNDDYDKKVIRYNKIIKEACEQSHRQVLPSFDPYIDLKNIKLDDDTLGIMAYEKADDFSSLKDVFKNVNKYKNIAIVIGPEGGFEKSEVDYLSKIGFISVSLGKRILRSETASMALLSIIGYELEG